MGYTHAQADRGDRILRSILAPILIIPGSLFLLAAVGMGASALTSSRGVSLPAAATAGAIGAMATWVSGVFGVSR